jgi:hypothetical protein
MWMTTDARLPSAVRDVGVPGALAVCGVALTAALVVRLDTGPALLALVGGVAGLTILAYPRVATLLAVFLLYANLPIATRGALPAAQLFAASFAIPLAIPFVHGLIKGARPIFDSTFALMLAYLLVLLVSAFGAVDWRVAVLEIATYAAEGLALYWLLLQAIRTRTMLRRVMWTIVVTGALLGRRLLQHSNPQPTRRDHSRGGDLWFCGNPRLHRGCGRDHPRSATFGPRRLRTGSHPSSELRGERNAAASGRHLLEHGHRYRLQGSVRLGRGAREYGGRHHQQRRQIGHCPERAEDRGGR